MVPEISWFGGPNHPLLMLLQERHYEASLQMFWMIRILNVAAALEARGYPLGQRTQCHLEIEDDVIPDNTGRYVLEVEEGSARVNRGGNGSLRMHIRGLAPLRTRQAQRRATVTVSPVPAHLSMSGILSIRLAGALLRPELRLVPSHPHTHPLSGGAT